MIKCKNCIFFDKSGFQDMGFTIPTCKLKETLELLKDKKDRNLFNSLLYNEDDSCKYHKYVCEIVDIVLKEVNGNV